MLRIEASADPAFGSDPAVERAISVELLRQVLASSLILGAFEGAQLLGVVGLGESEMTATATLFGLFVTASARARGIGRVLVQAVVRRVDRDSRLEALQLYVDSGNDSAISLYEAEGFDRDGADETSVRMLRQSAC